MSQEHIIETYLNQILPLLAELKNLTQEVLDDARSEKIKLNDLLRFYKAIKESHDELDALRKELNKLIEISKSVVIPELMLETGVKTITLDDIKRRFTVSSRITCSILDAVAGFEWLRSQGQGDLIRETVNSGTLSSYAKQYLEETGAQLPPDIFKTNVQTITSMTKVK